MIFDFELRFETETIIQKTTSTERFIYSEAKMMNYLMPYKSFLGSFLNKTYFIDTHCFTISCTMKKDVQFCYNNYAKIKIISLIDGRMSLDLLAAVLPNSI